MMPACRILLLITWIDELYPRQIQPIKPDRATVFAYTLHPGVSSGMHASMNLDQQRQDY